MEPQTDTTRKPLTLKKSRGDRNGNCSYGWGSRRNMCCRSNTICMYGRLYVELAVAINMQYKSSLYCEHANETPVGLCGCPVDCACREHMCRRDKMEKTAAEARRIMNRKKEEEAYQIKLDSVLDKIWDTIAQVAANGIDLFMISPVVWRGVRLDDVIESLESRGFEVEIIREGEPDIIEGNKHNAIVGIGISWAEKKHKNIYDGGC